ncbi:EF hand domain-containing protein [Mariniflexile fucanivorans]|uniref:EF hand domain-containing protein n=1 Tax=Mariniflexile fucanivorans TaxID=264023 RepID=A0A4R1RL46_9FLAO|nr:EF-hand domain-containing protein [Mariniflexile fucanivorans]TCL66924.1 EF hand domain-containing protein [Mariniflexile fucanivorans]
MNKNKLKLGIAMLGIVLLASCKSSEGENKKGGQPSIEKLLSEMDANKDGKLSKTEVSGPLKTDFSKIDTDKDGFLSEAELKNAPKPERQGGQGGPPDRN